MYFKPRDFENYRQALLNGKVGLFPFDTIWGVTSILDINAINRIYDIKRRPKTQPLIVLCPVNYDLSKIAKDINLHTQIIDYVWPGPVSLILNKTEMIPDDATAGLSTVAIRIPDYIPLNYLLNECGCPLVSTSANISTEPVPSNFDSISQEIKDNVDFVVNSFEPLWNQESTIVNCLEKPYPVLRQGRNYDKIPKELLA